MGDFLNHKQFKRLKKRDYHRSKKRFKRERRANLLAKPGKLGSALVLDNLKPDFNIGKIFRSADAFGVSEVHLIGIDYFDPSSGVGSFRWVPAKFNDSFDESYENLTKEGFTIFALEPSGGELISEIELPKKSAFVLGHEQFGLSFDTADYPEIRKLTIPQFGKVQSLNVSIAASLVLYEHSKQHGDTSEESTNYEFVADDRSLVANK